MSYLLDTNVVSEIVRPQPSIRVLEWVASVPSEALHISVLSFGEIRKGIELLNNNKRKEQLILWLDYELPKWFNNRVLNIDHAIADHWGKLQAQVKRAVPAIDSLLAATALHHNLKLVTRNIKDFHFPQLEVINPWD